MFFITSAYGLNQWHIEARVYVIAVYINFAQFLLFFFAIFYEVIRINDSADNFTHALARNETKWGKRLQEIRLNLYIDSVDDPVSYTIAGVRMTKDRLIIQIAVSTMSFLIGLIFSLASNDYQATE